MAEFERTLDVALLVVVAGAITSATPRHKTLSPNFEVRIATSAMANVEATTIPSQQNLCR